jgi:hypothetical protein
MIIVSENNFWIVYWTDGRRNTLKIISKWRKNRGQRPHTALAYKDKMGRVVIEARFPVPVNVRAWCSKALARGMRYR